MKLAIKSTSRADVLQLIRRCNDLADLADSEDTRLLLLANVTPKAFLAAYLKSLGLEYPAGVLDYLTTHKKIIQSELYIYPNQKDRTRPIATEYKFEKPHIPFPRARSPITYNIQGRDRLALWYAAANHDLSGSKAEGTGLWLILKFWRLPHIQRNWRAFTGQPKFKLPEDAQ